MQITIANTTICIHKNIALLFSDGLLSKLKIFSSGKDPDASHFVFSMASFDYSFLPSFHDKFTKKCICFQETERFSIFQNNMFVFTIDWISSNVYFRFWVDEIDSAVRDRILLWSIKLVVTLQSIIKGGIPIHSSCAHKPPNAGVVFCGPSKIGKSTIQKMLVNSGWNSLDDEVNIIMPHQNNIWFVYPTPFSSKSHDTPDTSDGIVLRKIFILQQSTNNYNSPMSRVQQFSWLVKTAYTFPTSSPVVSVLMSNIEKIIGHVSIEMLFFCNHSSIVSFVETIT